MFSLIYCLIKDKLNLGHRRLVIETDNVEVVDILEGNSGSLQSNTLLSAIQHMLHLEWDVRIRKIGRDYNRDADALARASRGAPVGETIFDSIPSVVYNLITSCFLSA
ncbi:hypothetical protein GQ457_18G005890 [Hibiscus cannabinus]